MYQVMIVDDEPEALERIEAYVHQADLGFHVVAKALGGEEALFSMNIVQPDVIITDVKMPVLDGLAMLQTARNNGWNGTAVLISGYDEFRYAQQAIRLDCHDYLLKPIFPDTITTLLTELKDRYRQQQLEREQLRTALRAEIESPTTHSPDQVLPHYIVEAKAFVQAHFAEPITLATTADHVAISPAYLSYRFSQLCHMNFIEFVTSVRIKHAQTLLAQTHLQVQEIAQRVGYLDVGHFNRVFRRVTKQTPSQYRKATRRTSEQQR